ncbi:glycogen debranching protein [Candidatus Woesearchaeota archaeon]|nr:MAG: glycogen debranching protein [Candidatus Woesearchaeota archaeon]
MLKKETVQEKRKERTKAAKEKPPMNTTPPSRELAYAQSLQLLIACSSPDGFLASTTNTANYQRVWARDSMICSLAALLSDDAYLIGQVKKSLVTLMRYQHRQGEIPSNVDVKQKKVSYGGSAGRVDATLWFLVGFGQYVKRTNDIAFLKRYYPHFRKAIDLVRLYEFNHKHLIYVPISGDWADEYIQEGYTLYDELLYYQAFKEFVWLRKKLRKRAEKYEEKAKHIKKVIITNFQLKKSNLCSPYLYNKIVYKRALQHKRSPTPYFLPCFNPGGYYTHFDAFANALTILLHIATPAERERLKRYLKRNFIKHTRGLIPAFWPVITPGHPHWDELRNNYATAFRNKPHEYHNGGLWPMITGMWAAAFAKNDKQLAEQLLDAINTANQKCTTRKEAWCFYEYHNSKTFKPRGTKHQAWSAAAGIIAHQTIAKKKPLFLTTT